MAEAEGKVSVGPFDPLSDLFAFGRDILGYDMLGKLHIEWFEAVLKNPFVLLMAPRSHLKSTTLTIVYTLWRLTRNPNLRVLILNEILGNAQSFLREIKGHLTNNARFRERFGDWSATATKWTESTIIVPRPRIMKEPSVAVCGVLGTVVSMHPDLILADDLISTNNSLTLLQRSKVSNWFRTVVIPMLEPHGQLVMVGTRFHYADLYSEILTEPGFARWAKIVQRAEWLDDAGQRHILFPERFTPEKLDELRETMGTVAFNAQMCNDPSGLEGSDFKAAWIEQGRYEQLPDKPTVFSGVDLAIGRSESNSRFAVVTIALDSSGTVFIVNAYRDRIPFAEQLKAVKRIHRHHHPRLITVESNGFQAAFIETLRTDPETRLLPLKAVNTQGEKYARLRGLAPLFEAGAIRLPRREVGTWVEQLEEELLQFPRAATDDVLDALWIALQAVEFQRVEPRIRFTDDDELKYQPGTLLRDCPHCEATNKASALKCFLCLRPLKPLEELK